MGFPHNLDFIILNKLFIVILPCLCVYLLVNSNWFKKICLAFRLKGPPALPIIGNCHLAVDSREMVKIGTNAYEEYGSLFRVWISFIPFFVVSDPKDLQNILGSSRNTDKNFLYSLMLNFLGTGLLTTSGHKWKKHRKLLQPSFNLNILETFVDCFSDSSTYLIDKLKSLPDNDKEINITSFINNSVLNVLNESVLGIPVGHNSIENSPFRQGKVVTQDRIDRPWLIFDFIYNLTSSGKTENSHRQNLISFLEKVIEKRKIERSNGIYLKDKTSLLERMLDIQEENPDFTNEDIINEVSTFMLAGQESVATAVSFCMYFLAKHKDVQTRLYDEQCSIFADSNKMPNMKDLQEMIYLEQCLKETLRLIPSVPLLSRKLGESLKIGNHVLPEGSNILITPFITQRIKHIYPDPEKFNPERFTIDNSEKRPPCSFIPFSAGPRNCIGYKFAMLEMKTIMSTLIRHYELVVHPDYTVKLAFRITVRAKGGIWIKLKPRKINNNVEIITK